MVKLFLELLCRETVRAASALNDGTARCGSTAHEYSDANEALVADHGDLRRGTLCRGVHQRDDRVSRKIHMAQGFSRLVYHLGESQRDELEMWIDSLAVRGRQCSQNAILLWKV